jgi:sigma-B regulation protein RsbU (phosphoserine phosphatase)
MATLYEQRFPARTEVLGAVRTVVREVCRQAGCGDECSEQMVLAVNEACMNIIQHGYHFADGQQFTLRLSADDGVLTVCLLDHGAAVSTADLRPRELDELRPGGLGVHFIRELMDDVDYLPAPNGFTNCLQMRKRIC